MEIKYLYIFQDPMGAMESKIGITANPIIRLGVYQNSYSYKSHMSCFDVVYGGPNLAIALLERAVKNHFDWHIAREGRGYTEWISKSYREIETAIDKLIVGYCFKIIKLDKTFTPVTVDNFLPASEWIKENYASTFNG